MRFPVGPLRLENLHRIAARMHERGYLKVAVGLYRESRNARNGIAYVRPSYEASKAVYWECQDIDESWKFGDLLFQEIIEKQEDPTTH